MQALRQQQEVALIDVRDEALYASGHPLFAVNIALSTLELAQVAELSGNAAWPEAGLPVASGEQHLLSRQWIAIAILIKEQRSIRR